MTQPAEYKPVPEQMPSVERVAHPRGLLGIGESEYRAGRPKRALPPLLEACRRLEEVGDSAGQVDGLLLAGRAAWELGRLPEAAEYVDAALGLTREIGDRSGEIEALNLRAGLLSTQGDEIGALEQLELALNAARAERLPERQAEVLANIGNLATRLGDPERAIECLQEALETVVREGSGSRTEAATHTNLGHLHRDLADLEKAKEHYTRAREVGRAIGDQMIEIVALNSLANVLGLEGEWALARQLFHEALAMARSLGFRQYEIDNLDGLGEAHAALGETERAVKSHLEAYKLARNISDSSGQLDALIKIGRNLVGLGRLNEALTFLEAARESAGRSGRTAELAAIHEILSVAHEELGDLKSALHHQRELRSLETVLFAERCERLSNQRAAFRSMVRAERAPVVSRSPGRSALRE